MAKTNAARNFEAAMRPQMQAIRDLRAQLLEKQGDLSALHGVQLVAEQVDHLATAVEELVEATADALDGLKAS